MALVLENIFRRNLYVSLSSSFVDSSNLVWGLVSRAILLEKGADYLDAALQWKDLRFGNKCAR